MPECMHLCVLVYLRALTAVVTLMLTQVKVFSKSWINAPLEGLEELLLTQAKVLAH